MFGRDYETDFSMYYATYSVIPEAKKKDKYKEEEEGGGGGGGGRDRKSNLTGVVSK